MNERILPWISSLLLHAVLLLAIHRSVSVPHVLPPGGDGVEVRLVGPLSGGGAGSAGPRGSSARPRSHPVGEAEPSRGRTATAGAPSRSGGHPPEAGTRSPERSAVGLPVGASPAAREASASPPTAERPAADGEASMAEQAVPRDAPSRAGMLPPVADASPVQGEAADTGVPGGIEGGTGAPGESSAVASGIGGGVGRTPGGGSVGSGRGGGDWRALLRGRIERAKQYPLEARRQGMEGTTEVQFEITSDGSVAEVMVVRSSGFALLDQASVETIRRAAPFPFIPGVIRLSLSYHLRGEQ